MDYLERIQNRPWRAVYKVIITIQRAVAIFTCIAIPLMVVYQVVLRYVLKTTLMGVEELLVFFIIWLYMIAGSVASEQRNHIECGILTLYIKKEFSIRIFNMFKLIFSTVIGVWLCRWAWWYFTYSLSCWKITEVLRIPLFFAESAVFVGFALMLFFTFLQMIDCIRDMITYRKEARAE